MGLGKSAIRGVVLNWLGQLGSLLITFFLTPFLILTLGNETYGLWSIVMGLSGYYGVADAGLTGTATKYIAQFESTGQRPQIKRVISTLVVFYGVLALITLVVAVCFALFFPFLFETAGITSGTISAVILIIALNFAIRLIGMPFRSGLIAMARFDLTNTLDFGKQLFVAIMMVLTLLSGGGLLAMACVTLGVGILAQLIQYWFATTVLGSKLLSPRFVDWTMARELGSFTTGLFVSTAAMRIGKNSGVIIVGLLLGPASSAFFSVGNSLVTKSDDLLQGIRSVVFPVACRISAQQRNQELAQIAILVPRVLLAMSITVTIVIVAFGQSIMDLWIKPGYSDHVYVLFCLLAFAMTVQQVAGGHRPVLIARSRIRFLAFLDSAETLLTIGLGAYLTFCFGLPGMGVAMLVVGLVHGIVLPAYACRLLESRWLTFMAQTVSPSLLAGLPTLATALVMKVFNPPVSMPMLILDILVVGSVGTVSLFFICLTAEVRAAILRAFFLIAGAPPVASRAGHRVDADASATSKFID